LEIAAGAELVSPSSSRWSGPRLQSVPCFPAPIINQRRLCSHSLQISLLLLSLILYPCYMHSGWLLEYKIKINRSGLCWPTGK